MKESDKKVLESLTAMETDALLKQLNRNIDNMVETKKVKEKYKKEMRGYFVKNENNKGEKKAGKKL